MLLIVDKEAIFDVSHKAVPGFVTKLYCHPAGGGNV